MSYPIRLALTPRASLALALLIARTGGETRTPLHATEAIYLRGVEWHRDARDRAIAASRYADAR